MNKIEQEHYALLGRKVVEVLNKKRFNAVFVPDGKAAREYLLELIPDTATVGCGGSMTLSTLEVQELLARRGNMVYDHQGLPRGEALAMRRKEMQADVFLASANALTLEGEIVNVDGAGNRVASTSFGPGMVVLVVGANKIVADEQAARARIKLIAAPQNAARLNIDTPCRHTGYCVDCQSPMRICAVTSIMHWAPSQSNFHVVVVGESLGY